MTSCTCQPYRELDGSEAGACEHCERIAHEERWGEPEMLYNLHVGNFDFCPRAACHSEDIDVGPGNTAYCNTCGVRW